MIISFVNRQRRYDPVYYKDQAQCLFDKAESLLPSLQQLIGQQLTVAVSITLAGPIVMRRVNREQRQLDVMTDILSFPMLDFSKGQLKKPIRDFDTERHPDGSRTVFLGDLFLSPDRAIAQAKEYGHSLDRECAFLLLHGLLHLIGYDHQNKRQEAAMLQLTEDILKTLNLTR